MSDDLCDDCYGRTRLLHRSGQRRCEDCGKRFPLDEDDEFELELARERYACA